jgi:hypothetical protein
VPQWLWSAPPAPAVGIAIRAPASAPAAAALLGHPLTTRDDAALLDNRWSLRDDAQPGAARARRAASAGPTVRAPAPDAARGGGGGRPATAAAEPRGVLRGPARSRSAAPRAAGPPRTHGAIAAHLEAALREAAAASRPASGRPSSRGPLGQLPSG